jgi:hypothetical protein
MGTRIDRPVAADRSRRIRLHRVAVPPVPRRTNRSRAESPAAIRADVVEDVVNTPSTERALERADHRVCRRRGELGCTVLADWSKFKSHPGSITARASGGNDNRPTKVGRCLPEQSSTGGRCPSPAQTPCSELGAASERERQGLTRLVQFSARHPPDPCDQLFSWNGKYVVEACDTTMIEAMALAELDFRRDVENSGGTSATVTLLRSGMNVERVRISTGRLRRLSVRPLGFPDARLFLPNLDPIAAFERYAIAGGMPLYLSKLASGSLREAIGNVVLNRDAPLFNEGRIIVEQELREPRVYFAILEQLAGGDMPQTRSANASRWKRRLSTNTWLRSRNCVSSPSTFPSVPSPMLAPVGGASTTNSSASGFGLCFHSRVTSSPGWCRPHCSTLRSPTSSPITSLRHSRHGACSGSGRTLPVERRSSDAGGATPQMSFAERRNDPPRRSTQSDRCAPRWSSSRRRNGRLHR